MFQSMFGIIGTVNIDEHFSTIISDRYGLTK